MDTSKYKVLGYWRDNYPQYPNSVYNTAYKCFSEYKCMYQNMQRVLDHLFVTIGNGYEWKNGAIVDRYEGVETIEIDGEEFPIDDMLENNTENLRSDFYDFIIETLIDWDDKMEIKINNLFHKSIVQLWLNDNPLNLDELEILERMANLGNETNPDKGIWYPLGKKETDLDRFHDLFATPDNVKKDWLDAARLTAHLMYNQGYMSEGQYQKLPINIKCKLIV